MSTAHEHRATDRHGAAPQRPGRPGTGRLRGPPDIGSLQLLAGAAGNRAVTALLQRDLGAPSSADRAADRPGPDSAVDHAVAAPLAVQRAPQAPGTPVIQRTHREEIEGDIAAGGINVALYIPPILEGPAKAGEFRRQATTWAENHGGVGVRRGRAVHGMAMPLPNGRPHQALSAVLRAVRTSLELEPDADVPLRTLAIFTHGAPRSIQLGRTGGRKIWGGIGRLRPLLDMVAASLAVSGDVIFYACNAAGPVEPVAGREYQNLVHETYAYLVAGGAEPEVWSHTSAKHTSGNPDTASTSAGGRRILYTELARRTLAHELDLPTPLDPMRVAGADVIARVEQVWERCLAPAAARRPMYALIEEIPLLGYETTFQVLTGEMDAEAALAGFTHYSEEGRATFARGVAIARERLANQRPRLEAAVTAARARLEPDGAVPETGSDASTPLAAPAAAGRP